jgi:hypothetical protein
MDVSHFLNSHLLDSKIGGKRLWYDMLDHRCMPMPAAFGGSRSRNVIC